MRKNIKTMDQNIFTYINITISFAVKAVWKTETINIRAPVNIQLGIPRATWKVHMTKYMLNLIS